MAKLKHKYLYIPILDKCIKVYTGNKKKLYKKYKWEYEKKTFAFVLRHDSKYSSYIAYIPKKSSNGIIAHEANHIKNMILEDVGYKPMLENDELECYILEYIVNQLHYICKAKKT